MILQKSFLNDDLVLKKVKKFFFVIINVENSVHRTTVMSFFSVFLLL